MNDRMTFDYYGTFTVGQDAFCLEGLAADDCLYVSRLLSPTEAVAVCVITGRDRNQSHELLSGGEDWPDEYRKKLIFAAVERYRMWVVDGPGAIGDGVEE